MNPILCQHNPKRSRFSLPNDIWKWGLKPQGFSILAYLCYLHTHRKYFIAPSADEIATQLHMSADMAAEQLSELNHRGLLDQHMAPVFKNTSKNFFSLPNEVFLLGLSAGELAVYSFLKRCENRKTHQCWPSIKTIGQAVRMSENTVRKYIRQLEERGLITAEPTEVITKTGEKRNGNLLFTLRPIREVIDEHYASQLAELELATERQRVAKLLRERESPA